ncbi:hypothetical protein GBM95_12020, partial [Sutterella seckii]
MDDIARVLKSQQDIKAQIIGGKKLSKLKIASDMKPYLKLTGTEDAPAVELCTERLQESIDRHGFNAIASSEDLPAERISEIYDYRDISEKQFSALRQSLPSASLPPSFVRKSNSPAASWSSTPT